MFFIKFKGFRMKICIYNNKGGVGKTTLASSIGFRAMEKGQNIVVVDADPQLNTMKLLTRDNYNGDESLDLGSVQLVCGLNNLENYEKSDFVVIDAPPEYDFCHKVKDVDVWIVPIRGRFSLDGATNVLSTLKNLGRNQERVVFVVMQNDGNTDFAKGQIAEAKKLGVELYKYGIGKHVSFEKAEMICCAVWEVPYSIRSGAVQALQMFANWVLAGCLESKTYGETNKRLKPYEV